MKTRLNILGAVIFALATLTSTSLFASEASKECILGNDGVVLNAVPMTSGASTRTFTVGPVECDRNASLYRWLVVEAAYTKATAGTLSITCTNGRTTSTATFTPQVCTGSGTCTMVDGGIFSKAVTASKNYSFRVGIRGYLAWSCVTAHSAAAAGDIVTANAYLTD